METVTLIWNILLMVIGFGVLIFVHELGHFLAAKWANIRTEAFAVGMGPVALSWRKGIGFCVGSSERKVRKLTGSPAAELKDEQLKEHGLGETEYSLRWLPIGGFVKMLGQEDANPKAVSDDPRSYNMCSVPKRMVVVSAGVIMNIILAVLLFIIVFQVGVKQDAPIVGALYADGPAATTMATNAPALGIAEPGLLPGDRVLTINGKNATTFADLRIASAMSRRDRAVILTIERDGYEQPLEFELIPSEDPASGLLGLGVERASSSQLLAARQGGEVLDNELRDQGLWDAGVRPGMKVTAVNGHAISTYEEMQAAAAHGDGQPLEATWHALDENGESVGEAIATTIETLPEYQRLLVSESTDSTVAEIEYGLLNLTPLVEVSRVAEDSPNADRLKPGDLILQFGSVHGPRNAQFRSIAQSNKSQSVPVTVLREGETLQFDLDVNAQGQVGIYTGVAEHTLKIAQPIRQLPEGGSNRRDASMVDQPRALVELPPCTEILAVNGDPVTDWMEFRTALQQHAAPALDADAPVTIELLVQMPTTDAPQRSIDVPISVKQAEMLDELAWTPRLPISIFDSIPTVLSSDGNPITAIGMGIRETHKLVMLTYLTIDRLFRGTVKVKELRGPVGIVHLGTLVADKGFVHFLFLLAMISVNLAVLNFLPLPIVDGGLFLFLIYEKFKGKPPSLAFQNVATIVGLCLIGAIFLVTLYNDLVRLLG
jgi:regulator of sigma E protease